MTNKEYRKKNLAVCISCFNMSIPSTMIIKKVFVSLALILLIGIIAFSIYIVMQGGKGLTSLTNNPTPTVIQQTALTLMPQTISVQPNELATTQVMIQNGQSKPAIIQIELEYDPNALSNVTIVPGSFFAQPQILFSRVNSAAGRISYSLQASDSTAPINPSAPVAIISFVPSAYESSAQTQITFLPKSVVKDQNNNNILNGMYGTTITLSTGGFNAIPSPTAIQTTLPTLPWQPTMTPDPQIPTPTLSY